jgi:uncharacterized membrane protein YhaH (DUF805 family)
MGFTEAIKKCMRDWITFSGRAPRSEYWWFALFAFIVSIVFQLIFTAVAGGASAIEGGEPLGAVGMIVLVLYAVIAIYLTIAGISAAVRRLHDKDKSGWFYWLILIPLIGAIILIVWFCQRGTVGPNQYGEDPLGGEGAAKVFE